MKEGWHRQCEGSHYWGRLLGRLLSSSRNRPSQSRRTLTRPSPGGLQRNGHSGRPVGVSPVQTPIPAQNRMLTCAARTGFGKLKAWERLIPSAVGDPAGDRAEIGPLRSRQSRASVGSGSGVMPAAHLVDIAMTMNVQAVIAPVWATRAAIIFAGTCGETVFGSKSECFKCGESRQRLPRRLRAFHRRFTRFTDSYFAWTLTRYVAPTAWVLPRPSSSRGGCTPTVGERTSCYAETGPQHPSTPLYCRRL